MKMNKKSILYLLIGFIVFVFVSVNLMLYSEGKKYERKIYSNLNSFINESEIEYYEMYDLYSYIVEDNKVLISDLDNIVISHNANNDSSYTIESYINNEFVAIYDIHYKPSSIYIRNLEVLYHKFDFGEVTIEKDDNLKGIQILFVGDNMHYSIGITGIPLDNGIESYKQKILNYIEEVYKLNAL